MFVPCKLSSKCSISPYVSTVGRSMSRVWLRMLDDFWSHLRPFVKFVFTVLFQRQLRSDIDLRTRSRSRGLGIQVRIFHIFDSVVNLENFMLLENTDGTGSHGFQNQRCTHHFSSPSWFLLSTNFCRFCTVPRNVIFPRRASHRLPIFAEAIIAHRPSNCPFGPVLLRLSFSTLCRPLWLILHPLSCRRYETPKRTTHLLHICPLSFVLALSRSRVIRRFSHLLFLRRYLP